MGSHTTEQIDFIRTGGCNEQIRLFHIRTLQHAHGGTVSLYPHNIVTLHTRIQHTLVRIDQSQVVSCRSKFLRQRESDLAITGDYYFTDLSSVYILYLDVPHYSIWHIEIQPRSFWSLLLLILLIFLKTENYLNRSPSICTARFPCISSVRLLR